MRPMPNQADDKYTNPNSGKIRNATGRYCSYPLPKQTGGTTQILIFKTLRMIGGTALYFCGWLAEN